MYPNTTSLRRAMEHSSEEARKKYLQEHPNADPKNHTVKPSGDESEKKDEKPKSEGGSGGAEFSGTNPNGDPASRDRSDDQAMKADIFESPGKNDFEWQVSNPSSVLKAPDKLKAGLKDSLPWMSAKEMKGLHTKILNASKEEARFKTKVTDDLRRKAQAMEKKHPGMSLEPEVEAAVEAVMSGKEHDGDLFRYIEAGDATPAKFKEVREKAKAYKEVADWMVTEAAKHLKASGKSASGGQETMSIAHQTRLAELRILMAASPRYRDYVRRFKPKPGGPQKPLSKDEWETKVLHKKKDEKPEKKDEGGKEAPKSVELSQNEYKSLATALEGWNKPGAWEHVISYAISGKPMQGKHVEEVVKDIKDDLANWDAVAKKNGWDANDKKNLTKAKLLLEKNLSKGGEKPKAEKKDEKPKAEKSKKDEKPKAVSFGGKSYANPDALMEDAYDIYQKVKSQATPEDAKAFGQLWDKLDNAHKYGKDTLDTHFQEVSALLRKIDKKDEKSKKDEKPKAEKKDEKPAKSYKKTYSPAAAEIMDKHSMTDDDAEQMKKWKKAKPFSGEKISDAEKLRRFLAKAKPETKERLKGMSPAEFVKLLGVLTDDEEGGGKQASAGVKLPEDFVDLVLKWNGSRIRPLLAKMLQAVPSEAVKSPFAWNHYYGLIANDWAQVLRGGFHEEVTPDETIAQIEGRVLQKLNLMRTVIRSEHDVWDAIVAIKGVGETLFKSYLTKQASGARFANSADMRKALS